ncbi:hypothetical protein [uncultured Desulfuromusa sp.]|uniref:hypothetical protein n=1 Tax=uncultured Desulfuromusa sp. TaxID=219183 RepID=UPI002AA6861E|nr:hypothetical protein [uncultured Desulfuromusa sp.]
MAMTKESMAGKIRAHIATCTHVQTSVNGDVLGYRDDVLEAMCLGIIEEIQQNAVVTTTSGAPDGEHTGEIE